MQYICQICRDGWPIRFGRGMEMNFLAAVIGVVLIIEGIPWFLSPRGVKGLLRQVLVLPDPLLRLGGLATMLAGLLVVWLATLQGS